MKKSTRHDMLRYYGFLGNCNWSYEPAYTFEVRHGVVYVYKTRREGSIYCQFIEVNRVGKDVRASEHTFHGGLIQAWPGCPWWIRKLEAFNRRRNSR